MSTRKTSIGVFDSGFGGLTILKSIVKELPEYHYVYLGDTARTPYGNRSQEVIYKFTREAVTFLLNQGCDLVILACNSASSEALRKIQQVYLPKHYPGKKVLGVLIPASEESVKVTKNKRIGVLATEGTVQSRAFIREITKISPSTKVFQKAAPLLAPVVEAGEQNLPATTLLLSQYLKYFKNKSIDTLILGCTHYSILENKIKKIMDSKVKVISEGKIVAQKLREYLENHPEIEKRLKKSRQVIFFSTDITNKFTELGGKFFGREIKVKKATLS